MHHGKCRILCFGTLDLYKNLNIWTSAALILTINIKYFSLKVSKLGNAILVYYRIALKELSF